MVHPKRQTALVLLVLFLAGSGAVEVVSVSAQGVQADPAVVANLLKRLDEAAVKIERLSQRVDKLEKTQKDLRKEVGSLKERTRRPRCSSKGNISMNPTTGETQDCKPYMCNATTGLCEAACTSADQCTRGFECKDHQCVTP